MKTEEDEAFDELARKQGAWGGGFQAKRAAAADKLREPEREALKLLEDATRSCNNIDEQRALDALMRGVQPAQEPVARVSGTYGGRFTYDPINPAAILPIGMALYAEPLPAQEPIYKITVFDNAYPRGIPLEDWVQPAQEPVARECNFCERCGKRTKDMTTIHTCTPPQEKSND